MFSRAVVLALLAPLAACGALPQPFFGNPGRAGARLAAPPPSRLAIPTPSDSLLSDEASAAWAEQTAAALADRSLPASHAPVHKGDWSLALTAPIQGASVIPTYTLLDPAGAPQAVERGPAIAARTWSENDPAVVKAAADQVAPAVETMLTRVAAARLHDDPNSLQNRPARVYLSGVAGAPGDGDKSLATQIKLKLGAKGIVVQDRLDAADYSLRGEVATVPTSGNELRLELQWVVDDANGERGRVVQLNEVPAASVSNYWGDVAVVAAEQAAGGIKEVLFNAAGPRLPAAAPAAQK